MGQIEADEDDDAKDNGPDNGGIIDIKLLMEKRGCASVSEAERKKYSEWKKQLGSAEQRDEAKQDMSSEDASRSEIRTFVKEIFQNTEKANDIIAFLVDPERGAFENIDD